MTSTGSVLHRFMARKLFLITFGSVPLTYIIFISSYLAIDIYLSVTSSVITTGRMIFSSFLLPVKERNEQM